MFYVTCKTLSPVIFESIPPSKIWPDDVIFTQNNHFSQQFSLINVELIQVKLKPK